jgi:hypothetical protein
LPNKEALSRGLRENEYVEGRNIAIEERFSGNDPEGLRGAAEELVRLNVDVILAPGTAGTLAAKRVTDTIPIVGGNMADPVADELVSSPRGVADVVWKPHRPNSGTGRTVAIVLPFWMAGKCPDSRCPARIARAHRDLLRERSNVEMGGS